MVRAHTLKAGRHRDIVQSSRNLKKEQIKLYLTNQFKKNEEKRQITTVQSKPDKTHPYHTHCYHKNTHIQRVKEENTREQKLENSKCFVFVSRGARFPWSFRYTIDSTMHRVAVRSRVDLNNPYDRL